MQNFLPREVVSADFEALRCFQFLVFVVHCDLVVKNLASVLDAFHCNLITLDTFVERSLMVFAPGSSCCPLPRFGVPSRLLEGFFKKGTKSYSR